MHNSTDKVIARIESSNRLLEMSIIAIAVGEGGANNP
jgi:hypothetical protein